MVLRRAARVEYDSLHRHDLRRSAVVVCECPGDIVANPRCGAGVPLHDLAIQWRAKDDAGSEGHRVRQTLIELNDRHDDVAETNGEQPFLDRVPGGLSGKARVASPCAVRAYRL